MGFLWIIWGFVLLANPIITVFDIFPDCIGFFFLWKGMEKLSYFNSGFSTARDLFLRLSIIELVRVGLIMFATDFSGSTLLLLGFVFGVLELIFFIPAIKYLFDGVNYVGMRYESEAVFAKKGRRSKKERGTSLKHFTVVFYALRVAATFVPEITEMQMYEYRGTVDTLSVDYTRFKPLFHLFFGLIIVIVGICWIVQLVRYFGGIRREKDFIKRLQDTFDTEFAPKTWIFMAKRMKMVFVLWILAVVFSLPLEIDSVSVLPGVISGVFLVMAAILLGKEVKGTFVIIPLSAARGILSIVNIFLQKAYFIEGKFDEVAIKYVERAAVQYVRMSIIQGIEQILALASFAVFALLLNKAVKKHIPITGARIDTIQYSTAKRDAEVSRTLTAKIAVNTVFAAVNFISSALFLPLLPTMDLIGFLRSVVTVLWTLYTLYTVAHLNDTLYTPLANDMV